MTTTRYGSGFGINSCAGWSMATRPCRRSLICAQEPKRPFLEANTHCQADLSTDPTSPWRSRSPFTSSRLWGRVAYASAAQEVKLAAGENRGWDVKIPVGADWGAGLYAAYLTVGDPSTKCQIHQALEFVPVNGSVKLDLASDKAGYRLGEKASFTLKASSPTPWNGEIRWGLYDFRGRLLHAATQSAKLAPEPRELQFSWTLADHGVRVDTVWAEATAVKDGREWGRAEAKIYKHDRWNMRNEYQWSTLVARRLPFSVPRPAIDAAHGALRFERPRLFRELRAVLSGGALELAHVQRGGWHEHVQPGDRERHRRRDRGPLNANGSRKGRTCGRGPSCWRRWARRPASSPDGGRTYYWDEPIAPAKACQAFQRFLKERYPSVDTLNLAWGTHYGSWDEISLTKEFSGQSPKIEADGWAHPKDSPIGANSVGVTLAPYHDTTAFYHWYYDKVVEVARRYCGRGVNPVPLTMASAPASPTFVAIRARGAARRGKRLDGMSAMVARRRRPRTRIRQWRGATSTSRRRRMTCSGDS